MAKYPRDPYITIARWDSKCDCGAEVKKYDSIFYYPNTKSVKGGKCGCAEKAERDFAACVFDEMQYR